MSRITCTLLLAASLGLRFGARGPARAGGRRRDGFGQCQHGPHPEHQCPGGDGDHRQSRRGGRHHPGSADAGPDRQELWADQPDHARQRGNPIADTLVEVIQMQADMVTVYQGQAAHHACLRAQLPAGDHAGRRSAFTS